MGAIKLYLSRKKLKDRELHNSRLFVDLCENIHIHYREYRFVFSIDEFFEFIDVLIMSMKDIRNYLYQNPDYKEMEYANTVMIACGENRQIKFLKNSPKPNCSAYNNNDLNIELQEECITDEIHVHYRDFRIVLNRENFKDVAEVFIEAYNNLIKFENNHNYIRKKHTDRAIKSFNTKITKDDIPFGIKKIKTEDIKSHWYKNLNKNWLPNKDYVKHLKHKFRNGAWIPPILVTQNYEGAYYIIDGHHRYYTVVELGLPYIDCVVIPMKFDETENLRKCEVLLKQFDKKTHYKYNLTSFLKDFLAFKFNRHYVDDFSKKTRKNKKVNKHFHGLCKRFLDVLHRILNYYKNNGK